MATKTNKVHDDKAFSGQQAEEFDAGEYTAAFDTESAATFDPDGDDDGFVFDFTAVQAPKPIEGEHPAKVKIATSGRSKKGNPKIDVQWLITDGDHEGKTVRDNTTFVFSDNETQQYRIKRSLRALGLPENFRGGLKAIAAAMLDAEAIIVCRAEQSNAVDPSTGDAYPDKTRVVTVRPSDGSQFSDEDFSAA